MATLSFLLAPSREIPEKTDEAWFARCCGWIHGTFMAWINMRGSLPSDQRPRGEWFDSPNLTTNMADYFGFNRPEHKEIYRNYVSEQIAAWQQQGCPETIADNGPMQFCTATQTESQIGLDRLIHYRGLLRPIPAKQLKRGGKIGLLANQGGLFSFETEHERTVLQEIARAYGGDSLAMWTHGHTVQIVLLRAQAGAMPRSFRHSLRLARPSDRLRPPALLEELKQEFAGSSLTPDWSTIESQLKAPRIEVGPWFEAFGLPGAAELAPKDCAEQWGALETVGASLLRGETPDAALVKRLNSVLVKVGEDKVPTKPGKGVARRLFSAAWQLRQAAGLPEQAERWQQRHAAARLYWEITDSDALDQLTTGQDKQGKGLSASMGRLMTYYPESLYRDGWFWTLAAMEAESANGHAFVAGMETLAQSAHAAGFTLVILPADRLAAFREAFGIDGGDTQVEDGWSAEAFLDLPGMLKANIAEVAGAWFAKSKAGGVVVRCEANGECHTLAWKAGKTESDAAAVLGRPAVHSLEGAARGLNPSDAMRALGLGNLLRRTVVARNAGTSEEVPATSIELSQTAGWPSEMPDRFPSADGQVLMLIAATTSDTGYVDELATDLIGGAKLKVRHEGSSIHASTAYRFCTGDIVALLGDLPTGSVWATTSQSERFRSVSP